MSDPSAVALGTLCAVAVAVLVGAEARGSLRWRFASKPVASAAFVALAWQLGVLEHPWGLAMFAGFVGCFWGDVLLMPADRRAFLAGIVAFALGHVGFLVAFLWRGVDANDTGLTALVLVPLAAGVLRWLLPHARGVMRVAIPGYIVIICAMVAAAVGTASVEAGGDGVAMAVGAMLFWLSDLCVARERFVTPGFVNKAIGLPLYYGAVLVLAWASRT